MCGAHGGERVIAARAGKQAEGEQQRERAETRHEKIDETRARVLGVAMMRDHQGPGRE